MKLGLSTEEIRAAYTEHSEAVYEQVELLKDRPAEEALWEAIGIALGGSCSFAERLIEENNRRLEEQLRSLGLLPPGS